MLANNKLSFFDECIVQRFHGVTVQPHNLSAAYVNFRDVYDLRTDDELNPITFQHSQMNLSRELVTFAIGGPRFSSNGVLLPFRSSVLRDCRHVCLSPLFRYHYELPTNPSANWIDPHLAWLVQQGVRPNRKNNVFEDADNFGYVSSQLTHLPKLIGYDSGNMLTFVEDCSEVHQLTDKNVTRTFLRDVKNHPFRLRTDTTAVIQREPLNDSSVYVVNRRSLLVNKNQVFYNDDLSSVLMPALATNALKWSESFLGNCSEVFSSGEAFEPIHTIALKFDKAKMVIFGKKESGGKVSFTHYLPINAISTNDNGVTGWRFDRGSVHPFVGD